MMLSSYKLISFDAGGTLFCPHPSVGEIYHAVAKKYGCFAEPDKIENHFQELWAKKDATHNKASHLNEKVEKDWWKHLVQDVFSVFEPIHDFDAFFEELYHRFASPGSWKLFPETLEVLEGLKQRQMRLCIISNWDSRLIKLCEGLGIDGYFEFILISAVFGTSKPNQKIFAEACQRADVAAHEVIHIGDSLEDDIHGARGFGMSAVLINRHERKNRAAESYQTVSDLRQLL